VHRRRPPLPSRSVPQAAAHAFNSNDRKGLQLRSLAPHRASQTAVRRAATEKRTTVGGTAGGAAGGPGGGGSNVGEGYTLVGAPKRPRLEEAPPTEEQGVSVGRASCCGQGQRRPLRADKRDILKYYNEKWGHEEPTMALMHGPVRRGAPAAARSASCVLIRAHRTALQPKNDDEDDEKAPSACAV
jgi:hypothetical protein